MVYDIFLDNNKIGTSILDKADAPMGCVSGQITFTDKPLSYNVIRKYCKDNNIIADEYPEDKVISTQTIPTLRVVNENGTEIKGAGCYLEGMDSVGYEITIIGIPYPFYGE
jgi:hypothetical protein